MYFFSIELTEEGGPKQVSDTFGPPLSLLHSVIIKFLILQLTPVKFVAAIEY